MIPLRTCLLNELLNTSTRRFERCLIPLHVLPLQKFCTSSDDDEKKIVKSKLKGEKDNRKSDQKRLDNLLQSFNKNFQDSVHSPPSHSSDDNGEKIVRSKSKENGKGDKEKTKKRLDKILQTFNKNSQDSVQSSLSHSSDDNGEKIVKSKSDENVKEDKEKTKKRLDNKEDKEKAKKRLDDILQSFNKVSYSSDQEIKIFKAKPKKKEEVPKEEEENIKIIDFSLRTAAKIVAESLGGDAKETESELLNALKSHASPKQNLKEVLTNMNISKRSKQPSSDQPMADGMPRSRLYEFKRERDRLAPFDSRAYTPIDLFSAPPLRIFPQGFKAEGQESVLTTWDTLVKREMKFNVSSHPRNHFEEMIKWTEEGKVWTFPVDNETGLEEEKSVSFADHIFLEKHLEGWCPQKGPIRYFMELVCVGLSKNPYITVERKKAVIEWYKNYFESKTELLKDVGAL